MPNPVGASPACLPVYAQCKHLIIYLASKKNAPFGAHFYDTFTIKDMTVAPIHSAS